MNVTVIPGTVLEGNHEETAFSRFRPMIQATGGLSLGQVCSITGLEISTIQNWVKRGFVPHPEQKRYKERQLARILLISSLRESMKIEQIGELLQYINGDTDDESDDIISEESLFDVFCSSAQYGLQHFSVTRDLSEGIGTFVAEYSLEDSAEKRLKSALEVMVLAYLSGELKRKSGSLFNELTAQ